MVTEVQGVNYANIFYNMEKEKSKKVKARGVGCFDPETQEFGFTPFNEGQSTQRDVKSCAGGGKRWTTTGADPSKMISLKCKESSPDPYADLRAQFDALTKDLKPKQPKQQPESQRVVSEEGLECWLNEKKAELMVSSTLNLNTHYKNWQAELLRQVQLVVRRLPASDKFCKTINNIKKGGTKNV